MLVDDLDEFDGDHEEILELFQDFGLHGDVKV